MKKKPGRGWHGKGKEHAVAGRLGGLRRHEVWKEAQAKKLLENSPPPSSLDDSQKKNNET